MSIKEELTLESYEVCYMSCPLCCGTVSLETEKDSTGKIINRYEVCYCEPNEGEYFQHYLIKDGRNVENKTCSICEQCFEYFTDEPKDVCEYCYIADTFHIHNFNKVKNQSELPKAKELTINIGYSESKNKIKFYQLVNTTNFQKTVLANIFTQTKTVNFDKKTYTVETATKEMIDSINSLVEPIFSKQQEGTIS